MLQWYCQGDTETIAGQAEKGGNMEEMTEKERQDTKMATLYELRLIFTNGEKEEYTKAEIVELLDKIAMAKEQE